MAQARGAVWGLHGMYMKVPDEVIEFIAADAGARPEALVLGARGLAQSRESHFQDRLADFIFDSDLQCRVLEASLDRSGDVGFAWSNEKAGEPPLEQDHGIPTFGGNPGGTHPQHQPTQ